MIVGPDGGHGVDRELLALRDRLGVTERVHFVGPLPREELPAVYADADVFVLPSGYENFGMVAAEAAAAGAAIVLTDRCGVAECFAGRGALVVPYDEAKLRDALARLLGDPELRRRLGEEAREVAEEWSWPRVLELQEDVYRRALARFDMRDLAIVAPDPGFGGGGRALTEALWRAAEEVGREPRAALPPQPPPAGRRRRSRLHAIASRSLVAPAPRPRGLQALARRAAGRRPAAPREDVLRLRAAPPRTATARCSRAARTAAGRGRPSTTNGRRGATASTAFGGPRTPPARPCMHRLERETLRRARVLWAISAASRRSLAALARVPEERIRVVPIPIDTERFSPLPDDEWERGLDAPRLVFVGRASDPRKNVTLLLDAFVRLRERVPHARLTLVGAPPTRAVPDGVDVLGEVASVAEPLRARDALRAAVAAGGLRPRRRRGARVRACRRSSRRRGGPEELVRESGGGEVLDGFDADELADRAAALLGDRDRLREMRRRGRAYVVREHDPARLRDALREALEELDAG